MGGFKLRFLLRYSVDFDPSVDAEMREEEEGIKRNEKNGV